MHEQHEVTTTIVGLMLFEDTNMAFNPLFHLSFFELLVHASFRVF